MDRFWPNLDPVVLGTIQRYFRTPLLLQGAFDDHDECQSFLADMFPDMVEEELRNSVAELLRWQSDSALALKRMRLNVVSDSMYFLPTHRHGSVDLRESFRSITQSSAVVVLELATKKKQRKYKEEPHDVRAKAFDSERRKYSILLANVIKLANLPVTQLVNVLDDPDSGWPHLFAARRANTLKNRYKSWKPFQTWLELHRSRLFPTSCKDIIDYMQFRVDEGCGKTVPESFSIALNLIEVLGRVPEDLQLSKDPLWLGHVKSWTAELAADSPPRRPAEMYTVAMIVSLELTVENDGEPIFTRALAWFVLVMIWAALRCDDVQAILPHRSLLLRSGLKLLLGKTKTTGPDKPQKEVMAHVLRTLSLTGVDWLQSGFDIWESDLFSYRRDFLVMEPTRDWDGVRRKFVTPSDLASLIRKLLSTLRVPVHRNARWELSPGQLLLPDGLESHFSGHSPRNFLTSVAACLGFSKDMRAYLGRWSIGMTSSEEYVRTARQVVFRIQRAVNRSIVEGRDEEYFEDEAIDNLCRSAESAGANPNRIRRRHTIMNSVSGKNCLGSVYPVLTIRDEGSQVIPDVEDDTDIVLLEGKARSAMAVGSEREAVAESSKYFITVSRRAGHRRLHLVGCFVKPSNCMEVRMFNALTAEDFDSICRACRKKMLLESGKETPEESSSTASSSSTGQEPED